MIAKSNFSVARLVAAADLALAVQVQATSSRGHSDGQGYVEQTNATQGRGGQGFSTHGLEGLAAGTTLENQPASGHGTGRQRTAARAGDGIGPEITRNERELS